MCYVRLEVKIILTVSRLWSWENKYELPGANFIPIHTEKGMHP